MRQMPKASATVVYVCTVPSLAVALSLTVALASAPVPLITGAVFTSVFDSTIMTGAMAVVSIFKSKTVDVLPAETSLTEIR